MIDRRTLMTATLGAFAMPATVSAQSSTPVMSKITAYRFSFPALKSGAIALSEQAGKPIMVVNTASQCGYTPQYTGLQQIFTEFGKRGFTIIAVPSSDFGGQEPGGASEIAATTETQYHITFPVAAKAVVKGSSAHPFYKWAAAERPTDVPRWNFHIYLSGRDGMITDAFPHTVEPTDTRVVTAIARQLGNA